MYGNNKLVNTVPQGSILPLTFKNLNQRITLCFNKYKWFLDQGIINWSFHFLASTPQATSRLSYFTCKYSISYLKTLLIDLLTFLASTSRATSRFYQLTCKYSSSYSKTLINNIFPLLQVLHELLQDRTNWSFNFPMQVLHELLHN